MRFLTGFLAIALLLLLSSSFTKSAVVQRRYLRHAIVPVANGVEQLIPVTIVQDGEPVKAALIKNEELVEPQLILAVDSSEQIVDAFVANPNAETNEEQSVKKTLADRVETVAVVESEQQKETEKPAEELNAAAEVENEESQSDLSLRQATQATPGQSTTPGFVQQLIQNSPLGPFFNQITGQQNTNNNNNSNNNNNDNSNQNTAAANDEPATTAPPTNFVGSLVNQTQQAIQGFQQFASNIGTQFQNTLSSFGGQQPQESGAVVSTTASPPNPIQQFVSSFIGNNNQQQTATTQQPAGPFQGLFNLFTGTNNNNNDNAQQSSPPAADAQPGKEPGQQPAKEPAIVESNDLASEAAIESDTLSNNITKDSAETNDSFEETVNPEEVIVVDDDASQAKNHAQSVIYAKKV